MVQVALLFSATDYLRLITQPLQRYLSASTPLSPLRLPLLSRVSGSRTPATVSRTPVRAASSPSCVVARGIPVSCIPSPKINTSLQLPVLSLTHPEDTSSASLRRQIQEYRKPSCLRPRPPCCKHFTHVNPRHKYSPAPSVWLLVSGAGARHKHNISHHTHRKSSKRSIMSWLSVLPEQFAYIEWWITRIFVRFSNDVRL